MCHALRLYFVEYNDAMLFAFNFLSFSVKELVSQIEALEKV